MVEEPRVASLLRRLRDDPQRDALLRQIERVVEAEQDQGEEQ
jgi:hypothetical protein